MSSTKKSSPKGQTKNKKAMSFHGRVSENMVEKLIRPRTVPELITRSGYIMEKNLTTRPKLTKLLLNVTIQRSLGPVHVLISPEATVGDLIASALRQYSKEGRRPLFPSVNPFGFDLHYSQFSLESLSRDAKLNELGSRNFFLCPKQSATIDGNGGCNGETGAGYNCQTVSSSNCSKEAEKETKGATGWVRFMEFLL